MTCTADRHGTLRAYNTGCRCPLAVHAHTRDEKRRRLDASRGIRRRVPAGPHKQQLRALMTLGWRARDLAPRIGWSCGELDTLFRRQFLFRRTAERIDVMYAELRDVDGPSDQTRRRAIRAGWPTPDDLDYPVTAPVIDEVAIERALSGDTDGLHLADRIEAIRRLLDRGLTVTAIAHRLRMSNGRVRELAEREQGAA